VTEADASRHPGDAPSVAAASSSRGSTLSIDERIARTISGKPITAAAAPRPPPRRPATPRRPGRSANNGSQGNWGFQGMG
jgi:hypothetical protein